MRSYQIQFFLIKCILSVLKSLIPNTLSALLTSSFLILILGCKTTNLFFEYSNNLEKWMAFFTEYGVWNIPAMYYSKDNVDTTSNTKRTSKINVKTGRSAFGFVGKSIFLSFLTSKP